MSSRYNINHVSLFLTSVVHICKDILLNKPYQTEQYDLSVLNSTCLRNGYYLNWHCSSSVIFLDSFTLYFLLWQPWHKFFSCERHKVLKRLTIKGTKAMNITWLLFASAVSSWARSSSAGSTGRFGFRVTSSATGWGWASATTTGSLAPSLSPTVVRGVGAINKTKSRKGFYISHGLILDAGTYASGLASERL